MGDNRNKSQPAGKQRKFEELILADGAKIK